MHAFADETSLGSVPIQLSLRKLIIDRTGDYKYVTPCAHTYVTTTTTTTSTIERLSTILPSSSIERSVDTLQSSDDYETAGCIVDSLLAFRLNLLALGIEDDGDDDDDDSIDDENSGREGDLDEDRDDEDDEDDKGGAESIDEDSPPEGPGSTICPPAVQLLLDIVARCCHLLPLSNNEDDGGDGDGGDGGDVSIQVIVTETLGVCFMRLCTYSSYFLPCVHRVWSCITARLVEMRAALLSHLLSIAMEEEVEVDHHHQHHHPRSASASRSIEMVAVAVSQAAPSAQMMSIMMSNNSNKHHPPHHRHSHQYHHLPVLLPLLLDLISILSITASTFMTSRFRDDLLPDLLVMLCAFQQQYVVHTGSNSTHHHHHHYYYSKYSWVTKIKSAVLRMLLQLTKKRKTHHHHHHTAATAAASIIQPIASTLAWFIVPCMAGHEVMAR